MLTAIAKIIKASLVPVHCLLLLVSSVVIFLDITERNIFPTKVVAGANFVIAHFWLVLVSMVFSIVAGLYCISQEDPAVFRSVLAYINSFYRTMIHNGKHLTREKVCGFLRKMWAEFRTETLYTISFLLCFASLVNLCVLFSFVWLEVPGSPSFEDVTITLNTNTFVGRACWSLISFACSAAWLTYETFFGSYNEFHRSGWQHFFTLQNKQD